MKLTNKHLQLYKTVNSRGIGGGCDDLNPDEVDLLTPDQWKEFNKEYHDWNGDPEEYNEKYAHHMMDFMVVGFVQWLLIKNYKETHGLVQS